MRRRFRPEDLDDAWLVVAAATPDVNRAVADAAAPRRVFVNAVDGPDGPHRIVMTDQQLAAKILVTVQRPRIDVSGMARTARFPLQ